MKRDITTRLSEIKRTIKYYECLYVNKLGNLAEMDKFLEKCKWLKKKHNLNIPITSKEVELIIKKTNHKEKPKWLHHWIISSI